MNFTYEPVASWFPSGCAWHRHGTVLRHNPIGPNLLTVGHSVRRATMAQLGNFRAAAKSLARVAS